MTLLTCQLSQFSLDLSFFNALQNAIPYFLIGIPNINQNPDFVKKKNKIKENMLLLNCKHNDTCISKQSTIIFYTLKYCAVI